MQITEIRSRGQFHLHLSERYLNTKFLTDTSLFVCLMPSGKILPRSLLPTITKAIQSEFESRTSLRVEADLMKHHLLVDFKNND